MRALTQDERAYLDGWAWRARVIGNAAKDGERGLGLMVPQLAVVKSGGPYDPETPMGAGDVDARLAATGDGDTDGRYVWSGPDTCAWCGDECQHGAMRTARLREREFELEQTKERAR